MTLLAPIPLATIGLLAAVLGGLALVAYILRMRRRRFEVPFTTLWQRVLKEKEASALWKHLRRILSLLLILCMLGLLLFAATEPRLGGADEAARNVVLIVDTSASMKATDEGPDGDRPRIEVARKTAADLLDTFGGGDAAMLMRMDGRTTPLSRFESDFPRLRRTVLELEPTDTPADLRSALSAAADALRDRQNPMIIIIGDGAYPKEVLDSVVWKAPAPATDGPTDDDSTAQPDRGRLSDIELAGIDVRFIPVGKRSDNVGIVAFNVRRYQSNKQNFEVFVELQNFGDNPAERKLVLYNGDLEIDVAQVALAGKERKRRIYPNLSGGTDSVLRASVESTDPTGVRDVFPIDDVAWALMPAQTRQKVLLVTDDNLFLEGGMLVYDTVDVDKIPPAEYPALVAGGGASDYHAIVFDNFAPEVLPDEAVHLLYFNPQGPHSPFRVVGSLEGGRITDVSTTHPVVRWVQMNDVNFDALSVFEVDRSAGEVALATSIRSPVAAARKDGARKIAAFGFSLDGTDLILRVAFPLLLVNSLDWFAGTDSELFTTYTTGQRARVPVDGTYSATEARILTPTGTELPTPISEGIATFYASEVGVHGLNAIEGGAPVSGIQLAANLSNPEESNIRPTAELEMGGVAVTRPEAFTPSRKRGIWNYLALLVLCLLGVEWYTYNRRITV